MPSVPKTIILNCVALGRNYLDQFTIRVTEDLDVYSAKKLVQGEVKPLFDALRISSELQLFDINLSEWDDVNHDNLRRQVEHALQDKPPIGVKRRMGEIFPFKKYQSGDLHIVAQSEKSGESNEDGGSDDDPNDDDIFNADDIQDILEEIGYEINFIPFGYPRVAFILGTSDDSKRGFLKFVRERHDSEISILKYLSEIDSPRNHTVAGARFWPVRGGQVISMPSAGSWITSLRDPDARLWSAAGQLFEAVEFMHRHGVAHLDLKPENVLMPLDGGRLSIIDFHTSVHVEGVETVSTGVVGTRGYIPPEVVADRGAFSAVRADLWSCGKTLSKLCDLCRPSADRDTLLQIAGELMDEDPERRPMMSDVLEKIANIRPL